MEVPVSTPMRAALLIDELLTAVLAALPRPRLTWCRQGEATHFLQTVASLCQAMPALGSHLGPQNQLFWRKSLFEWFDFSSRVGYEARFDCSVVDDSADYDPQDERHHRALAALPSSASVERYPFLTEDLVFWYNLGVFFFASEHGFLSAIQSGQITIDSFPDHVDAFDLFQDLSVIGDEFRLFSVHIDKLNKEIWNVNPPIFPVFLRCHNRKITPRGTDLLELTKLSPFWWRNNTRLVSGAWPGLTTRSHRPAR